MYPIASEETYQDGQVIFQEGTWGDWVYVVRSGSVEISKTTGNKTFVLSVLEQGELFGELGYLGVIKRTATARAIGKTTVGIIDRTLMDKEFNNLSGYFRTILVTAVKRFQNQIERSCGFSDRKHERVQKCVSLSFRDRQSFVRAYSTNMSAGGLFIRTDNPPMEGARFLLAMSLPGLLKPIKVKCEVVWTRTKGGVETRPAGMGVKFCEMADRDRQILTHYLRDAICHDGIDQGKDIQHKSLQMSRAN